MLLTPLKSITLIFQEELEKRLIADLKSFGVKGYTIDTVRGEGLDGPRISEWEGENIKLVIICSAALCESLLTHLQQNYLNEYAGIVYVSDVSVVRGERFM